MTFEWILDGWMNACVYVLQLKLNLFVLKRHEFNIIIFTKNV